MGAQRELDAERGRLVREQEELAAELAAARTQRDEGLLRAESEKQQVGVGASPPGPVSPVSPSPL